MRESLGRPRICAAFSFLGVPLWFLSIDYRSEYGRGYVSLRLCPKVSIEPASSSSGQAACSADVHCHNANPKLKLYRLNDLRGLYLEVKPSAVKTWRFRITLRGKASMFTLGDYPSVGLAEARERCEAARSWVKKGNPAQPRQVGRIKQATDAEFTFALGVLVSSVNQRIHY